MAEPARIYTVSEVNNGIKAIIDAHPKLGDISIKGEISNFKRHSSGHLYFSLKDDGSVLRSVMFRGEAGKLRFAPADGMKVIAHGRISVFPRDGQYQLYVDSMMPDGVGELYAAYERLKATLAAEGLFDPSLKKPLPPYPTKVALITSPTGAAVRDMLRILRKRYPPAKVLVCPVRVQGAEAPGEIIEAIEFVNRNRLADLIIAGRGGGSIEDLWAFNDEGVARAICASEIPVISAVGHEPDFTIADFAADLRAATPSNGAELAVPDSLELIARLDSAKGRLRGVLLGRLASCRTALERTAKARVFSSPTAFLDERRLLLDRSWLRLDAAMKGIIAAKKQRYVRTASTLDAISPIRVLTRGYAIAASPDGSAVRKASQLRKGDRITLRFAEGQAEAEIISTDNGGKENG